MKFMGLVIALNLLAGAGCKPGESAHLRAFQAELAQKDRMISQLRVELQATRVSMQERGISVDAELLARQGRINDLRRQLDYALSQIMRGEAQARDVIENQRRSFEVKMEGLQKRITELETQRAEKN